MNFPSTSFFVGRDTFLQTLHTTFADHQIVVISGSSGIGKTVMLREYVQRFSQHYQSIIWFNAATDETFLADLIAALQVYSLPIDINQGVVNLFQTLHNHMSAQEKTLLILDNFSYSFAIQGSPEQQLNSCVVVVTQAQQTPPEVPRLELTGLDAHDGAVLLLRQAGLIAIDEILDQAGVEQHRAAWELARELRGFPIALYLVGRYLRMTGCSVQDYLTAFRDYPAPLHLPTISGGIAMEEFALVCERSLIHLKEADPNAFEHLQVGALLLPEAIPVTLFESQAVPESETEPEQEIRKILLDSGLVTNDQNGPLLSIHRLIQDIIRQSLTTQQQQQQIKQALRLLHPYLPVLQREPLPSRLRIAGQIRHLAKLSDSESAFSDISMLFNEAADVFTWAATLFWEQQMIVVAEFLLRRSLSIWEHTIGHTHPTVATVLANLATMNSLLKNYTEAEAFAHRAIASKTSALGINHPDVLLTLDQLGNIYAEQGKQKEARQCYEKAIAIGDTVKLQHHPIHKTAMYHLALLHMKQESWAEAEIVLRKVCIARTSLLGLQDPATMEAWFSLAEVSIQQKNWQWASMAYQRALPVCEKLLGEEHPVTLGHLEQAARVLLHQGKISEAEHNLRRVLEVRERTLSDQHLGIATCLNGLAQVALAQEEYAEASALLERAQQIYANQPEPDHLALATMLDTKATIEIAQHRIEQAIATYTRALDLRTQVLGEEHLELVETLSHLATLYLKQKEYHRAEQYLLRALSSYQKAQKPEDMTLDPVLNGLAEVEIAREHFDMARIYLDRSRAIRELSLGQPDPRTTETIQKLASVTGM